MNDQNLSSPPSADGDLTTRQFVRLCVRELVGAILTVAAGAALAAALMLMD
jgi:hypothetical protein